MNHPAAEFIRLLTGDAESPVSFRALPEASTAKGYAEGMYGTLSYHLKALTEWNEKGFGIFVQVNDSEGEGFKDAQVKRLRALFIDLDRAGEPDYRITPTFKVQSRAGVHAYWVLDHASAQHVDLFTPAQKLLADAYDSDPAVSNPGRVMRLPGFNHLKEKPVAIHLIPGGTSHRHDADAVYASLGPIFEKGTRDVSLTSLAGKWRNELGADTSRLFTRLTSANRYRCAPPLSDSDVKRIFRQAEKMEEHPPKRSPSEWIPHIVTADLIPEKRVEWLWKGRVPLGMITIIEGHGGLGKSTVTLDLAARLSQGKALPLAEAGFSGPVPSLIISVEDSMSHTIVPRLRVANANSKLVHTMQILKRFDPILGRDVVRGLDLDEDLALMEKNIKEEGYKLIVLDPLNAFWGRRADAHKAQDVRRIFTQLMYMAEETNSAFLIVRHLTKQTKDSDPMSVGSGSIDIQNAARAVMRVVPDKVEPLARIVVQIKLSVGREPESIAYGLEEAPNEEHAFIAWRGAHSLTKWDLYDQKPMSELQRAVEFTQLVLSGGQRMAASVFKKRAKEAGISEATLKRAYKEAGVKVEHEGFPAETWLSISEEL